eukprot:m.223548 g.223548  ORF g.223548 m.223548 type:complete len:486 (-) comp33405_c1_seq1:185-1642(-)
MSTLPKPTRRDQRGCSSNLVGVSIFVYVAMLATNTLAIDQRVRSYETDNALPTTLKISGGGTCAEDVDCHYSGSCNTSTNVATPNDKPTTDNITTTTTTNSTFNNRSAKSNYNTNTDSNTTGSCVCDPQWTGPHCEKLNLLPARVGSGYPTHPVNNNTLPSSSVFTWGGAVMQDNSTGLYHGFFAEWLNHCPMTYATWATSTVIRHATSSNVDGPWTPREIAVPNAAGNPVLSQAPDGTFLLYFTSHRWHGAVRNCTGPVDTWGPPIYCTPGIDENCATGISLAHSPSLSGPWTIVYDVVTFSATNPGAPVFTDTGAFVMAYKTWVPQGKCIGIVSAESWKDFPYHIFPIAPHTANACVGVALHLEDPSNLWKDTRGNLHMLFHEDSWGGASGSCDGGKTWDYTSARVVYDYNVTFADNSVLQCLRREEPKVLLNAHGLPALLITQCEVVGDLPKTPPTPQFPAGETQHVTRTIMQPINQIPHYL